MFATSTKTFVTTLAVAFVLVASPSPASAGAEDLSIARAATSSFHDLDAAKAAGYGPASFRDAAGIECIATDPTLPNYAVMGIHYVNGSFVGDAVLDPARPEALVYQKLPNTKARLVAAEYIVFQGAWETAGNTAGPTLFGQPLKLIPMPNRYGLPPFYEIHAWIWQNNPSGIFKDYNPSGSCAN